MKIVLRIVGALFIAVGLFWFGRGTGLLGWPHSAAIVDYGAAVTALGIGLTWFAWREFKRPRSPRLTPAGFFFPVAFATPQNRERAYQERSEHAERGSEAFQNCNGIWFHRVRR